MTDIATKNISYARGRRERFNTWNGAPLRVGKIGNLARSNQDKAEKPPILGMGFVGKTLSLCAFLLLAAILIFTYAVIYGEDISRAGHSADQSPVTVSIGNDEMSIPKNGIRFYNQRVSGASEKLQLYRHWPSLSGYTDNLKADFNGLNGHEKLIFLTLEPRSMRYDMSGRIAPIYTRFFVGEAQQQAFGLVRQPMDAEAGFIDEDLYYAAASPYPFAARCVREGIDITTPFCIRDIHIGKSMQLTYRFHKKLLPHWIELDQALRAHVRSMITNL